MFHRFGESQGRLPCAALGFLLPVLFTSLAGCVQSTDRPDLPPPIFSIDKIRYWWEGDLLIVNVTIRNQADRPLDGPDPGLYLKGPSGSINVVFTDVASVADPWVGRWYEEEAQKELGMGPTRPGPPSYYTSDFTVGPMVIQPNQSLSAEFGFVDRANETQNSTFQRFSVLAQGRDGMRHDARYVVGCFNRNTPEFYGVRDDGAECPTWDCAGWLTETEYGRYKVNGKEDYIILRNKWGGTFPTCTATNGTGPYDGSW